MDYYKNIDHLFCETDKDDLKPMGIQYDVVTDLASEPVDIAFIKQHVRVDFNVDDKLLTDYLKAARVELEQWSQLSFGVKTMRFRALQVPKNYRLMFGRVDTITTAGFTNWGDLLVEGGEKVDIEYTTLGVMNNDIKIAICRQAASFYVSRENVINTKYVAQVGINKAKDMIRPYMNLTIL